MTAEVRIWQIHYRAEHLAYHDAQFLPLDNSKFADETLEFAVFQRMARGTATLGVSHWGALSWRFTQKTGLSGKALLAAVAQHPEADIFYMNPFPYNEALHVSPWWQGETAHPDFLSVSEAFFLAAGLPETELNRLTPAREFSLCNYFVGRPAFWAAYLPFVENALVRAETNLPVQMREKLHSTDADWRGVHHGATYVPFIVERLLPVFLRTAGRHLKPHKIPSPAGEARLDAALRDLRDTKDIALLTRSPRLLERWQHQRRDYFERHYGPGWCELYLERVMNEWRDLNEWV